MLTKGQKEEIINELDDSLKKNKMMILADFRGLSVKDINDLKKSVKEVGGKFKVAKKTLVNIALEKNGVDLDTRKFTGPLAFVFGPEETSVSKKIWSFAKSNEKLRIEAAVLRNQVIEKKEIETLAKLPAQNEMQAILLGALNGPVRNFVSVMAGTVRNLINTVKAISEKQPV